MLLGPQPGIDPGINPRTCLRSHRRHSCNFPGPTCSVKGAMDSNMYCDILKQMMMPSLQKLFSNITTTPNTPPRWQLPCCWRWRWWSGQVCLQTWTLLSTCGESSSGRWRSTMCLTSSSSVMSLWRSGRGCQQQPVQLWWIPCPGGLRKC